MADSRQSSNKEKKERAKKPTKNGRCHYCKKPGHHINECKNRIAKEKRKASRMAEEDVSIAHTRSHDASTNYVDDVVEDFCTLFTCSYDPPKDTYAITMRDNPYTLFFDSGAFEHITSRRELFGRLMPSLVGRKTICANKN